MTPTESTPARADETRSPRVRRLTVAALVTLGLAGGGTVAAASSFASGGSGSTSSPTSSADSPARPTPPPAPSRYDLDGTVTAVSSGSITVKSLFGTSRTYTLTDDTTVHSGRGTASAASLETGQHVAVRGAKSGSGYTAKDVDVRPAHVDGAVAAVSGDTLTVTDPDGFTRTIALSSGITVTKDGKSSARSALVTGSVVHAEGSVASDGTTLDATRIDIRTKDAAPKGPGGGPGAGAPKGPGAGPAAPGGSGGTPAAPPSGAPKGAPSGAPSAPAAPSNGSGSGS